ncbi:hypothetical protein [Asticcacaulis sp. W401b]|uniref:hypothetical protein n=1 Tax=Asticcacaulis sp. W401b TaxID=3388666 RepID=UPI0039704F50
MNFITPASGFSPTASVAPTLTAHQIAMRCMDAAFLMGSNRIELSSFDDSQTERLKAIGLFHEIISWKLRFFVPVSIDGVAVLRSILKFWPIERVMEKEGR